MDCRKDHPRACGEHPNTASSLYMSLGSSPRMRGTPVTPLCRPREVGIIPAHAGNTVGVDVDAERPWDHPRACGEHITLGAAKTGTRGSSPRMRGTPSTRPRTCSPTGDHPRACGEHAFAAFCPCRCWGSSPRMRGTRPIWLIAVTPDGIIPAHAGNTPARTQPPANRRDHPRACGEHCAARAAILLNTGSSPRMRGTRFDG